MDMPLTTRKIEAKIAKLEKFMKDAHQSPYELHDVAEEIEELNSLLKRIHNHSLCDCSGCNH